MKKLDKHSKIVSLQIIIILATLTWTALDKNSDLTFSRKWIDTLFPVQSLVSLAIITGSLSFKGGSDSEFFNHNLLRKFLLSFFTVLTAYLILIISMRSS